MSKSWQTFDGKMRNLKQHTQLIDLALTISQKKCAKIRKCDKSKGSIRLDLGDKENNHLHLNHPNDGKNVNRIFAFSRSKINEQVVVEVYRIFTDYMVHILREIFASSPKRLLSLASNKDDKQMSFMEILNAGTYDELQDQMSLKIYRSLERQKSTPKLLEKFIRVSGININQDLKRKALLFLEIRHLIIHNNSKADEKFTQMNNEGLVSVNTRNRKITINFYLVNSAINSVFALCKAIDQELERVGLVYDMDNSGNKRIAKNTAILYVRLIFTMLIGLYTSRLILKNLGVNDFGIYNVVGGVVSMFAVVSSSLSAAISRFLTFKLGQNDINGLRLAFSTSVFIQFLLCLIIVILAEPIGLWFMHNKMTIPLGRIPAAEWVFHFSLVTFCLDLINVPYRSLIIAHERMDVYSYLSIFEVAAKLLVVVLLVVAPIDRLVFYSLLLVLVSLVSRIVYGVYCSRSFKECNINFVFDKTFFRQMFSFAGWNFIGAIASVLRDAGGNVVINLFYPPAVNAARGISIQVRSAVCSFSSNFITAINPPITKSFAKGETDYTFSLVFSGAKWSFYLLYMLALPVLINTHYILSIWLGIVPEYTVVFVRLILLLSLVDIISETLITLMLATGNIRNYQIVVGGLVLLNLPLSYMFLKLGFEPQVVFIVSILISMICIVVRVGMLKLMVELPVKRFLKEVLMKIIIVSFISFSVPFIISFYIEESFGFFVLSCLVCLLSTILGVGLLGMTNNEKEILKSVVRNKIISKIK